ncbi:MAG: TIGR04283 family arsenosugar biosynthesis glycosyltransferase [Pseudomonadota bacterium]|nr:TIGR04283 family arsenosugar biosynthesis glycosyltransferase [Pseudomonadota bacterium]
MDSINNLPELVGCSSQEELSLTCYKPFDMIAHISLSIVIPALNAAQTMRSTLVALQGGADEILVIDGGSTDGTVDIAKSAGAVVNVSDSGRGAQLQLGGQKATGAWLLFLHADTKLGDNWGEVVCSFMSDPKNRARAAVFRFALDDPSPQARRIEKLVHWRSNVLGLPYGDQALLISREYYDMLGGYRPMPLMEDVDIVRRIGKKNLTALDALAVTSAERYRQGGWWRRPLRNVFCLSLYLLGVPPLLLNKVYR